MDGENVYIVNPATGTRGYVPKAELATWAKAGYRPESEGETNEARLQQEYGDSPIQAGLEGAARSITFGLSDVALAPLDQEGIRERRHRNEGAALVGELGGAVLGGGVGLGGKLTQAGITAEESLVAGRAATMGTKLAGAATRGAVEGAGYGAGAGVSQLALDDKPITFEGAAATIGSNVLGGAVLGGGIGVGAKLLAEGAAAAKIKAQKQLESMGKTEDLAQTRAEHPDIAGMDQQTASKELVKARGEARAAKAEAIKQGNVEREAELNFLDSQATEQSAQLYKDAKVFKNEMKKSKNFIPTDDAETRAMFKNSSLKIKKGLNNRPDFIDKRGAGTFQKGLQEQQTVLEEVLQKAEAVDPAVERAAMLDALPKQRVPSYQAIDPLAPSVVEGVTAKELERAGLFELPGAGVDEGRLARVTKNLGKAEEWNQPIRLTMDSEGRMFIEDGRHRLRAALAEGGERPLTVEIDRAAEGFNAAENTVQLGKSQGLYLSPEQAEVYSRLAGVKVPKGESLAVTPEQLGTLRSALENGDIATARVARAETARAILERNMALQERFAQVQAKPMSQKLRDIETKLDQVKHDATPTPRIQALEAHLADLQTPRGLGHSIAIGAGGALGGKLGFAAGGPVGAMAGGFLGRDLAGQAYEKLTRRIAGANAARQKAIKVAVAKAFEKGAEKAAKVMPQATKIIPAIQYASPEHVEQTLGPDKQQPSKNATVNAFRQRARELNSVTEPAGMKVYKARMQAKEALHERLAGLWDMAADLANGVEKLQAMKWEYLASKLPRNPAPPTLQLGPDTWEPSEQQIASFARIMKGAETPEFGAQQLAQGTATPEDVETLKTIWPSHYEDMRQQCFTHAATLQRTLPYVQRLNLSILLDVDVDPGLTSAALSVYQAPKPPPEMPQSKTKPLPTGMVEPTQAQRLASK